MTTGLKVWLWIIFILSIIGCILNIIAAIAIPVNWLMVIGGLCIVVGSAIILFQIKKLGFYFICLAAVISFIGNIVIGSYSIIAALIGAIIVPLITYLLMKKNWTQFS